MIFNVMLSCCWPLTLERGILNFKAMDVEVQKILGGFEIHSFVCLFVFDV